VIRDAIVSYFRLIEKHPEADETLSSAIELLLILDRDSSAESLEVLAGFLSYDVGTHGGELLSCLLIRKGSRTPAALRALSVSTRSDCITRLHAETRRCLKPEEVETEWGIILRAVDSHERCDLTDFW